jgi:hypothetical protein
MGQLSLLVHNGFEAIEIEHESPKLGFEIVQDADDASLSCTNFRIAVNGQVRHFFIVYNCKDAYPLFCQFKADAIKVFNNNGEFTAEFLQYCK